MSEEELQEFLLTTMKQTYDNGRKDGIVGVVSYIEEYAQNLRDNGSGVKGIAEAVYALETLSKAIRNGNVLGVKVDE